MRLHFTALQPPSAPLHTCVVADTLCPKAPLIPHFTRAMPDNASRAAGIRDGRAVGLANGVTVANDPKGASRRRAAARPLLSVNQVSPCRERDRKPDPPADWPVFRLVPSEFKLHGNTHCGLIQLRMPRTLQNLHEIHLSALSNKHGYQ